MRGLARVVAAAGLLVGCGTSDVELSVDVRTDFAPGSELTASRTVLDGVPRDRIAATAEHWLDGVRVADYGGLAGGAHTLDVTLFSGTTVLATRRVAISLTRSLALTVVMARSCRGVVCPRSGDDASATTCVAGECASPECGMPGRPSCPGCHADVECTSSPVVCAPTRCTAGACLRTPDPTLCAAGESCDVAAGCVPPVGAPDAGLCHTCCGGDADCPPSLPRCDTATQLCEACSAATEAIDCVGTSCVSPGSCSTTPVDSVATCGKCAADHECADPRAECVRAATGTAGYCMLRLSPPCAGAPAAFTASITTTSMGGVAGDYCGPAVGCGPYAAFGRSCSGTLSCDGGSCGEPPAPRCTFRCSTSSECPPPASCNGLGYCQ